MGEADKIIKGLRDSGKKVEEFYMSNKTSDKNVGSIEEDVDELKSIMNLRTDSGFAYSQKNTLSLQKAIKNVLTDYTRQKQINEEHQKINGKLRERVKELEEENAMLKKASNIAKDVNIEDVTDVINKSCKEFMSNYIPKQVVIDLIENETIDISGFECIAVEDLQELLEGGK